MILAHFSALVLVSLVKPDLLLCNRFIELHSLIGKTTDYFAASLLGVLNGAFTAG